MMEYCPKCGFERRPQDMKCPKCGVIYLVYSYYLAQKQMDEKMKRGGKKIPCPNCGALVEKKDAFCPACEALLCFDNQVSPRTERLDRIKTFNYGQMLLREKEYIFEKIHSEQEMVPLAKHFSIYIFLLSFVYGISLGLFSHNLQILASSIKVPFLLFGTLLICLPALYIIEILFGSKLSFQQTLILLLASTYRMSVLLASMSPILFLFVPLTTEKQFISVLNIIIFSISGVFGLRLLWAGMHYLTVRTQVARKNQIVKIWYAIYVLIGAQLAWILRPFIGEKGEFVLFRKIEGNFYLAITHILSDLFK